MGFFFTFELRYRFKMLQVSLYILNIFLQNVLIINNIIFRNIMLSNVINRTKSQLGYFTGIT